MKKRLVIKVVLWVITSFVMALVILFFLHRPAMDVVAQWAQPKEIEYDGLGPYYLSVVASDLDWRGFPIHIERNYFLYAGRDSGPPSYGHLLKFSFHPYPDDLKAFFGKATVQWANEGVRLTLASQHDIFIPKDMFIGGR